MSSRRFEGQALLLFLILPLVTACTQSSGIMFDLDRLNSDGLEGPPDGLRAIHYEFCIPADSAHAAQVRSIDATVQFLTTTGRVGCSTDEYLCLGSTHQPEFRRVLEELAGLEFVDRIVETFFEE